ncbi:MAG: HAD family hydrolase [Eubacteriales bacterium]
MARYKGLVLDHDDTVVDSTRDIHYPSFLKALEVYRPGTFYTLEEFLLYSCEPGIHSLFSDILGFTKEEMDGEFSMWQEFVRTRVPHFFPGMARIIEKQRQEGGLVFAVSHSSSEIILRDYAAGGVAPPDVIYGWELGEGKRKPDIFPLTDIMERYSLSPQELIVIDDLKPGMDMAHSAGVEFACAGWGNAAYEVEKLMRSVGEYYFSSPDELYEFLFENGS